MSTIANANPVTFATSAPATHTCGGTIHTSPPGVGAYRYCGRCGAYRSVVDDRDLIAGEECSRSIEDIAREWRDDAGAQQDGDAQALVGRILAGTPEPGDDRELLRMERAAQGGHMERVLDLLGG